MREPGLVFGCIDLAVDHDGNYYFLEVNRAGRFLFVEDMMPAYPVLQTMTALLAVGRIDASIGVMKDVPMQQFRELDAFARLK